MPAFAHRFFGDHPNSRGITFVPVGGHSSYGAFIKIAEAMSVPWLVFSDAEPEAIGKLDAALKANGQLPARGHEAVVLLPDGMDFEDYLIAEIDSDALAEVAIEAIAKNNYHITALREEYEDSGDKRVWLRDKLNRSKTRYCRVLARRVPEDDAGNVSTPPLVEALLSRLQELLERPR